MESTVNQGEWAGPKGVYMKVATSTLKFNIDTQNS